MSIVKNSPDMNIVNQINAALNDVRSTMVDMSALAERREDRVALITAQKKVRYQTELAMAMVIEHQCGRSISWSDRKPLVEEEFSS
jgi:hypothetical protein